jgi:hypothetical protein
VASANRGHVDEKAGTVTIPAGTHSVTVHLKTAP